MTVDDYFEQATSTAKYYMRAGFQAVDDVFGEGYAQAHPELVAAYMRTAAADFHTSILTQQAIKEVCRAIDRLGTADAATPMGALEHVAAEMKEGFALLALSVDQVFSRPDEGQ